MDSELSDEEYAEEDRFNYFDIAASVMVEDNGELLSISFCRD